VLKAPLRLRNISTPLHLIAELHTFLIQ